MGKVPRLIAKLLFNDRKRKENSKSALLSKLPVLPHEIEIKGELRDEEELLALYKEVEEKKTMATNKRKEIAFKKVDKLEKEKQEHLTRLQ